MSFIKKYKGKNVEVINGKFKGEKGVLLTEVVSLGFNFNLPNGRILGTESVKLENGKTESIGFNDLRVIGYPYKDNITINSKKCTISIEDKDESKTIKDSPNEKFKKVVIRDSKDNEKLGSIKALFSEDSNFNKSASMVDCLIHIQYRNKLDKLEKLEEEFFKLKAEQAKYQFKTLNKKNEDFQKHIEEIKVKSKKLKERIDVLKEDLETNGLIRKYFEEMCQTHYSEE